MCRKDLTVFLDAQGRRVQTALMVLDALLGTLALLLVADAFRPQGASCESTRDGCTST